VSKPARVLLIDDDDETIQFVELNLRMDGFDVEVVRNGETALARLPIAPPDLLLLDVTLPGIDGLEVTHRVRADPRTSHLPVIMLTGRGQSADKVLGLTAGADDYLLKPCDTVELIARVRSTLRRNAEMRSLSPLTGLPGNHRIEAEIVRRRSEQMPLAVCYCDLDGFKSFNDAYGWIRGDEAINLLAAAAREAAVTVADSGGPVPFVGHVGGDDLVVICEPAQAHAVTGKIIDLVDAGVPRLYDPEDAHRGYLERADRQGTLRQFPLISVSIGVAVGSDGDRDARQLVAAATEMKTVAKRQWGSVAAFDRRRRTGADHAAPAPSSHEDLASRQQSDEQDDEREAAS
jgi:CheY-like chemotaxis protein